MRASLAGPLALVLLTSPVPRFRPDRQEQLRDGAAGRSMARQPVHGPAGDERCR